MNTCYINDSKPLYLDFLVSKYSAEDEQASVCNIAEYTRNTSLMSESQDTVPNNLF